MREIKFRCWDKKTKKMRQVPEIVFNTGFGVDPNDNTVKLIWVKGQNIIENKEIQMKRENNFILMQYTGLKDKNGKEIYEGDIIQHLYEYSDITDRYLVDWDEEELRYVFQNLSNRNNFCALEDMYDDYYGDYAIEVIGNIYDNPELLEV